MIPDWWEFILLALAAFRCWWLIANDKILDKPRDWVLARISADEFVECPWCAGAWITLAWWGAWVAWDETVYAAVPFALSAAVAILAMAVDRLAD